MATTMRTTPGEAGTKRLTTSVGGVKENESESTLVNAENEGFVGGSDGKLIGPFPNQTFDAACSQEVDLRRVTPHLEQQLQDSAVLETEQAAANNSDTRTLRRKSLSCASTGGGVHCGSPHHAIHIHNTSSTLTAQEAPVCYAALHRIEQNRIPENLSCGGSVARHVVSRWQDDNPKIEESGASVGGIGPKCSEGSEIPSLEVAHTKTTNTGDIAAAPLRRAIPNLLVTSPSLGRISILCDPDTAAAKNRQLQNGQPENDEKTADASADVPMVPAAAAEFCSGRGRQKLTETRFLSVSVQGTTVPFDEGESEGGTNPAHIQTAVAERPSRRERQTKRQVRQVVEASGVHDHMSDASIRKRDSLDLDGHSEEAIAATAVDLAAASGEVSAFRSGQPQLSKSSLLPKTTRREFLQGANNPVSRVRSVQQSLQVLGTPAAHSSSSSKRRRASDRGRRASTCEEEAEDRSSKRDARGDSHAGRKRRNSFPISGRLLHSLSGPSSSEFCAVQTPPCTAESVSEVERLAGHVRVKEILCSDASPAKSSGFQSTTAATVPAIVSTRIAATRELLGDIAERQRGLKDNNRCTAGAVAPVLVRPLVYTEDSSQSAATTRDARASSSSGSRTLKCSNRFSKRRDSNSLRDRWSSDQLSGIGEEGTEPATKRMCSQSRLEDLNKRPSLHYASLSTAFRAAADAAAAAARIRAPLERGGGAAAVSPVAAVPAPSDISACAASCRVPSLSRGPLDAAATARARASMAGPCGWEPSIAGGLSKKTMAQNIPQFDAPPKESKSSRHKSTVSRASSFEQSDTTRASAERHQREWLQQREQRQRARERTAAAGVAVAIACVERAALLSSEQLVENAMREWKCDCTALTVVEADEEGPDAAASQQLERKPVGQPRKQKEEELLDNHSEESAIQCNGAVLPRKREKFGEEAFDDGAFQGILSQLPEMFSSTYVADHTLAISGRTLQHVRTSPNSIAALQPKTPCITTKHKGMLWRSAAQSRRQTPTQAAFSAAADALPFGAATSATSLKKGPVARRRCPQCLRVTLFAQKQTLRWRHLRQEVRFFSRRTSPYYFSAFTNPSEEADILNAFAETPAATARASIRPIRAAEERENIAQTSEDETLRLSPRKHQQRIEDATEGVAAADPVVSAAIPATCASPLKEKGGKSLESDNALFQSDVASRTAAESIESAAKGSCDITALSVRAQHEKGEDLRSSMSEAKNLEGDKFGPAAKTQQQSHTSSDTHAKDEWRSSFLARPFRLINNYGDNTGKPFQRHPQQHSQRQQHYQLQKEEKTAHEPHDTRRALQEGAREGDGTETPPQQGGRKKIIDPTKRRCAQSGGGETQTFPTESAAAAAVGRSSGGWRETVNPNVSRLRAGGQFVSEAGDGEGRAPAGKALPLSSKCDGDSDSCEVVGRRSLPAFDTRSPTKPQVLVCKGKAVLVPFLPNVVVSSQAAQYCTDSPVGSADTVAQSSVDVQLKLPFDQSGAVYVLRADAALGSEVAREATTKRKCMAAPAISPYFAPVETENIVSSLPEEDGCNNGTVARQFPDSQSSTTSAKIAAEKAEQKYENNREAVVVADKALKSEADNMGSNARSEPRGRGRVLAIWACARKQPPEEDVTRFKGSRLWKGSDQVEKVCKRFWLNEGKIRSYTDGALRKECVCTETAPMSMYNTKQKQKAGHETLKGSTTLPASVKANFPQHSKEYGTIAKELSAGVNNVAHHCEREPFKPEYSLKCRQETEEGQALEEKVVTSMQRWCRTMQASHQASNVEAATTDPKKVVSYDSTVKVNELSVDAFFSAYSYLAKQALEHLLKRIQARGETAAATAIEFLQQREAAAAAVCAGLSKRRARARQLQQQLRRELQQLMQQYNRLVKAQQERLDEAAGSDDKHEAISQQQQRERLELQFQESLENLQQRIEHHLQQHQRLGTLQQGQKQQQATTAGQQRASRSLLNNRKALSCHLHWYSVGIRWLHTKAAYEYFVVRHWQSSPARSVRNLLFNQKRVPHKIDETNAGCTEPIMRFKELPANVPLAPQAAAVLAAAAADDVNLDDWEARVQSEQRLRQIGKNSSSSGDLPPFQVNTENGAFYIPLHHSGVKGMSPATPSAASTPASTDTPPLSAAEDVRSTGLSIGSSEERDLPVKDPVQHDRPPVSSLLLLHELLQPAYLDAGGIRAALLLLVLRLRRYIRVVKQRKRRYHRIEHAAGFTGTTEAESIVEKDTSLPCPAAASDDIRKLIVNPQQSTAEPASFVARRHEEQREQQSVEVSHQVTSVNGTVLPIVQSSTSRVYSMRLGEQHPNSATFPPEELPTFSSARIALVLPELGVPVSEVFAPGGAPQTAATTADTVGKRKVIGLDSTSVRFQSTAEHAIQRTCSRDEAAMSVAGAGLPTRSPRLPESNYQSPIPRRFAETSAAAAALASDARAARAAARAVAAETRRRLREHEEADTKFTRGTNYNSTDGTPCSGRGSSCKLGRNAVWGAPEFLVMQRGTQRLGKKRCRDGSEGDVRVEDAGGNEEEDEEYQDYWTSSAMSQVSSRRSVGREDEGEMSDRQRSSVKFAARRTQPHFGKRTWNPSGSAPGSSSRTEWLARRCWLQHAAKALADSGAQLTEEDRRRRGQCAQDGGIEGLQPLVEEGALEPFWWKACCAEFPEYDEQQGSVWQDLLDKYKQQRPRRSSFGTANVPADEGRFEELPASLPRPHEDDDAAKAECHAAAETEQDDNNLAQSLLTTNIDSVTEHPMFVEATSAAAPMKRHRQNEAPQSEHAKSNASELWRNTVLEHRVQRQGRETENAYDDRASLAQHCSKVPGYTSSSEGFSLSPKSRSLSCERDYSLSSSNSDGSDISVDPHTLLQQLPSDEVSAAAARLLKKAADFAAPGKRETLENKWKEFSVAAEPLSASADATVHHERYRNADRSTTTECAPSLSALPAFSTSTGAEGGHDGKLLSPINETALLKDPIARQGQAKAAVVGKLLDTIVVGQSSHARATGVSLTDEVSSENTGLLGDGQGSRAQAKESDELHQAAGHKVEDPTALSRAIDESNALLRPRFIVIPSEDEIVLQDTPVIPAFAMLFATSLIEVTPKKLMYAEESVAEKQRPSACRPRSLRQLLRNLHPLLHHLQQLHEREVGVIKASANDRICLPKGESISEVLPNNLATTKPGKTEKKGDKDFCVAFLSAAAELAGGLCSTSASPFSALLPSKAAAAAAAASFKPAYQQDEIVVDCLARRRRQEVKNNTAKESSREAQPLMQTEVKRATETEAKIRAKHVAQKACLYLAGLLELEWAQENEEKEEGDMLASLLRLTSEEVGESSKGKLSYEAKEFGQPLHELVDAADAKPLEFSAIGASEVTQKRTTLSAVVDDHMKVQSVRQSPSYFEVETPSRKGMSDAGILRTELSAGRLVGDDGQYPARHDHVGTYDAEEDIDYSESSFDFGPKGISVEEEASKLALRSPRAFGASLAEREYMRGWGLETRFATDWNVRSMRRDEGCLEKKNEYYRGQPISLEHQYSRRYPWEPELKGRRQCRFRSNIPSFLRPEESEWFFESESSCPSAERRSKYDSVSSGSERRFLSVPTPPSRRRRQQHQRKRFSRHRPAVIASNNTGGASLGFERRDDSGLSSSGANSLLKTPTKRSSGGRAGNRGEGGYVVLQSSSGVATSSTSRPPSPPFTRGAAAASPRSLESYGKRGLFGAGAGNTDANFEPAGKRRGKTSRAIDRNFTRYYNTFNSGQHLIEPCSHSSCDNGGRADLQSSRRAPAIARPRINWSTAAADSSTPHPRNKAPDGGYGRNSATPHEHGLHEGSAMMSLTPGGTPVKGSGSKGAGADSPRETSRPGRRTPSAGSPVPTGVYFDASRKLWRCQWRENGRFKTKGFSLNTYGTLRDARKACVLYRCLMGGWEVDPRWLADNDSHESGDNAAWEKDTGGAGEVVGEPSSNSNNVGLISVSLAETSKEANHLQSNISNSTENEPCAKNGGSELGGSVASHE